MTEFRENVDSILPYDREEYKNFLDDDKDLFAGWYGISFQLNNEKEFYVTEKAKIFESVFKNIIAKFDTGSFWIINHDDKDLCWFPDNEDNLKSLRTLFQQHNIQSTFRGALLCKKDDLMRFAVDLILYSSVLSYKNLDISHGELQVVIKMTSHLTLDVLSTDKTLLQKTIKENSMSLFNIKEYRGSSL